MKLIPITKPQPLSERPLLEDMEQYIKRDPTRKTKIVKQEITRKNGKYSCTRPFLILYATKPKDLFDVTDTTKKKLATRHSAPVDQRLRNKHKW